MKVFFAIVLRKENDQQNVIFFVSILEFILGMVTKW